MKIKFNESATAELEKALDWYGERSQDAARRLAREIDNSLSKIVAAPTRFLKLSANHRACRVMDFPYQVIYRVVGDDLIIVAIAHASRRPGYWLRRR